MEMSGPTGMASSRRTRPGSIQTGTPSAFRGCHPLWVLSTTGETLYQPNFLQSTSNREVWPLNACCSQSNRTRMTMFKDSWHRHKAERWPAGLRGFFDKDAKEESTGGTPTTGHQEGHAGKQAGRQADWLAGWLAGWLANKLTNRLGFGCGGGRR
ncbi:hypothetical protein LX36DRAFT_451884 [Colletotrichum falcatum]|nr:hypothetical protein LX36DRAFT_451884 [Colletotrichum falcatum]